METQDKKKVEKREDEFARLNKAELEKEAVGALLSSVKFAGTSEADNYEIPEVEKLDVSLPKRIRVFVKGPDIYEREFKPSPIKQELFTIKEGIEKSFRKAHKKGGVVELTGMNGLVADPVYRVHGPAFYVAFLEHYIERTAENIGRAINKTEAGTDIEELERKNRVSFDGRNFVQLDDMDAPGQKTFREKHGVSKRELLEGARVEKLKHGPDSFAASVGREMFGHGVLESYTESDAGMIPLGGGYAYKRIMHSEAKHRIAGVDRKLSEIFEGLHGLGKTQFRGEFGETKRRVVESIGDKFYREDIPEMYGAYVGDLKEFVKKTPENELKASFSGGRTYKELLGGETPDELRRDLAAGVEDYKKAIKEVSSLFVPEQYEAAKKMVEVQDGRFSPKAQYQKDMLAKERVIAELESAKKKKMLKDPTGGEFIEAYIRANYGK